MLFLTKVQKRQFLITILLGFLLGGCQKGGVQPVPVPTPVPSPPAMVPLSACSGSHKLCQGAREAFLVGYSGYGAFSLGYTYDPWLETLRGSGITLLREWASPFPFNWGGEQPYTFASGEASLNEAFWKNVDSFLISAASKNQWILMDLLDHYGVQKDRGGTLLFSDHPLNVSKGGPLRQGLPDLYDLSGGTSPVLRMMLLGVKRVACSGHQNVIYQVVNEPGGYRNESQVTAFHKVAVAGIRQVYAECGAPNPLIAINPVPNAQGRPVIPLPLDVGADLVTIHGAGVENASDASTCKSAQVRSRLEAIWKWVHVPVISDTDGLHATNVPCNRDDPAVLLQLLNGAKTSAGFNHRGEEPVNGSAPDLHALEILKSASVP